MRFLRIFATLIVAFCCANAWSQDAATMKKEMLKEFERLIPAYTNIGKVKVERINIESSKKHVTVKCSQSLGYLSFSNQLISDLKSRFALCLPAKYRGYSMTILAGDTDIEQLVEMAGEREIVAPTESARFITEIGGVTALQGLDGCNIALWQSHGWYFEPKLNRWEWQRARIFQTVEDLYTQSYVMPFLMPMLENAGAYVLSPRERDVNTTEIIVDGDGQLAQGTYVESCGSRQWSDAQVSGFAYVKDQLEMGDNPFKMGKVRVAFTVNDANSQSVAQWSAAIPQSGKYAVYVSYATLPNSATDALYRIHSRAGVKEFRVNQQMGGGTWIYLGHFSFDKSDADNVIVELVNLSNDNNSVVTADAVKIGGGMGNVVRKVKEPVDGVDFQYVASGYPRFTEGARYWLQWAGIPDSVYTPSDNVNDYTDDYKCRGEWVNYLAGGSSVLPQRKGLNIPIDMSLAFHTDAGTTMNDSIIGTLSIYCTDKGQDYANGTSRLASRDYTEMIVTSIVDDIRAAYEPRWTRRAMWDKSYYEARVPEVPSMLLELLSHQNFADMKYGLDPTFRFTVSRAIYKGMLKFIAERDGRAYVVQPLPINSFAITETGAKTYQLSWAETIDTLEVTAKPSYYIIEERIGDGEFVEIARVGKPKYKVTIGDDKIHSYRIIAGNEGGVSFPSEILALCDKGKNAQEVLIVNGFTRISGPDWFDAGDIAGFYDARDHGVPYISDISYIGEQVEFRRNIPWMDDDAAGFGASHANYETKVIAGNTFDYVYTHGEAIAAAGYSFVSMSVDAYTQSTSLEPVIVDLILGKQKEIAVGRGAYGTKYKTFPVALQERITAHCNAGASVFVSGAFVATDLWDNTHSDAATLAADQTFAADVLGYKWRTGQAAITGEAYQVQSRFNEFGDDYFQFNSELASDCYVVESPDSFYPSDDKKGATIMRYTENNLIAGIAYDNKKYRTVVIGFPFETIIDRGARENLMTEVLRFLSNKTTKK